MKAAYDRGLDGAKFRRAFRAVGVETCDVQDHVVSLRNDEEYSNIQVSTTVSPTFYYALSGLEESISVYATSQEGDVYITLSSTTWGEEDEEEVEVYAEGYETVHFDLPFNPPKHITVSLTTFSTKELKDVVLGLQGTCSMQYVPEMASWIDPYCTWFGPFSQLVPGTGFGAAQPRLNDDTLPARQED